MEHRPIYFLGIAAACLALFSLAQVPAARASQLSYVSDTIGDSRLSWPTNHSIIFQVTSGIPASGKLVIAFQGEPFLIDPSFSFTDVDFAVSTSSPVSGFVERPLSANPSAASDGVAVTSVTGPVTITLASGSGISAGSYVRILLGTNAPLGAYQITNPSSTASYRILFNTYDGTSASIDYGATILAILPGVGVDANTDKVNPAVLSNGLPSGTIPSNVSGVLVSFNTDTFATCHYGTVASTSYGAMVSSTVDDSLGTLHTWSVTGITKGTTYLYYVRCRDFAGNENPDDYIISFTAGDPTGTGVGGGPPGSPGNVVGGSGGGGGGGGGAPYPPGPALPSLTISGVAFTGASMAVLEDGTKIPGNTTAGGSGNFSLNLSSLAQGTYSFTIQVLNGASTPISSYTATITLVSGSTNNITGIVLPPAIGFATDTIALGKSFTINGLSEPLATIDLIVTSQTNARSPFEASTTADGAGKWSYALAATGFPTDTYQVKARSLVPIFGASNFSAVSFLGVGQAPVPSLKIGDLNGDGKVNLVDFSILLAHWGTTYEPDDLNGNGSVDLPDLSILLFHWTG